MRQVGHVAEIWRYPVKGMGGERLNMSALGPCGLIYATTGEAGAVREGDTVYLLD